MTPGSTTSTDQTHAPVPPPAEPIGWEEATSLALELGSGAYLASVQADGRPHVAWVMLGVGPERLWFCTFGNSQKVANLRHAPEVSLHWPERADRLVFARASARLVDDRAESDRLWDEGVLPYDPSAFFDGKGDPLVQFVELRPSHLSIRGLDPTVAPRLWAPGAP